MILKAPDFRSVVALLTAAAIVLQQVLAGTHWSTAITAIVGALVVHSTTPPAPPSANSAAPSLLGPAVPSSPSSTTRP